VCLLFIDHCDGLSFGFITIGSVLLVLDIGDKERAVRILYFPR
ncbi:unnamed protein product, partial [marine sediment metagenome]